MVQPRVRRFELLAVRADVLLEDTVFVSEPVAYMYVIHIIDQPFCDVMCVYRNGIWV
jgi:hypothetical protein